MNGKGDRFRPVEGEVYRENHERALGEGTLVRQRKCAHSTVAAGIDYHTAGTFEVTRCMTCDKELSRKPVIQADSYVAMITAGETKPHLMDSPYARRTPSRTR